VGEGAGVVLKQLGLPAKRRKREEEEETTSLFYVVQLPEVTILRDKALDFQCVIRHAREGGGLLEAFLLRFDEQPGKNYLQRESKYTYWRKQTRLLNEMMASGRVKTVEQIQEQCRKLM
jgi:hypothetical protein